MRVTELPKPIQSVIATLVGRGLAVWLVGSRANPTSKPPNDWDFVVFGDSALLQQFRSAEPIPDLDLLIVMDGDNFECPWPRQSDGVIKKGSLVGWNWLQIGDDAVTYEGTKWPDDWGSQKIGVRIVL